MTEGEDDDADPGTFLTVAGPGEARFEVRGSEFLGYVAPADSVEAAEAFAADVAERHADATHNVPAYRVPAGEASGARPRSGPSSGSGPGSVEAMLREYASDDGEPTGSAGKPALNVLVQRDLRNVAAVVARYYGGTNLGVGGLARAYSRGVKEAVDATGVVERVPRERFSVTVEYDDSGTVRGILESAFADADAEFEADYGADVSFDVRVRIDRAAALRDRLRSATSGRADIE